MVPHITAADSDPPAGAVRADQDVTVQVPAVPPISADFDPRGDPTLLGAMHFASFFPRPEAFEELKVDSPR